MRLFNASNRQNHHGLTEHLPPVKLLISMKTPREACRGQDGGDKGAPA